MVRSDEQRALSMERGNTDSDEYDARFYSLAGAALMIVTF